VHAQHGIGLGTVSWKSIASGTLRRCWRRRGWGRRLNADQEGGRCQSAEAHRAHSRRLRPKAKGSDDNEVLPPRKKCAAPAAAAPTTKPPPLRTIKTGSDIEMADDDDDGRKPPRLKKASSFSAKDEDDEAYGSQYLFIFSIPVVSIFY
jgi:hypothetical protein